MSEEATSSPMPENEKNENAPGSEQEKNSPKEHHVVLAEYQKVRAQFDHVLNRHILRLIEIDTESRLKFDTLTVSCLVLLVERDREIKNFPNSPPERYVRETFFNDLSDIGLEIDDDLMAAFETLVKLGYVGIDANERYSALISTLALVKFIDNIFSGMPGLNLIAYIIQCIDEILGGRKELKENLANFEQILVSRGVAISKQNLREEEKESIKKTATTFRVSKESLAAAEKLKRVNVQKLASLRTLAVRSSDSKAGSVASRIKDVFPRRGGGGDSGSPESVPDRDGASVAREIEEKEEAIRKREEALRKAEEAALELERKKQEIAEKEKAIKDAEFAAREAELALKEAELKAAQMAAKEMEMAKRERELAEKEAEFIALKEKESAASAQMNESDGIGEEEDDDDDDADETDEPEEGGELSIEEKIAAFEAELAMPCPVCSIGKIVSEQTDKGKNYFVCTNPSCKFVSWAKPYHFSCPLCKNPYLIEMIGPDGVPGLKCPRAACLFTQRGLFDPQASLGAPSQSLAAGEGAPKKKKRIIRRKKQ
jgi:hypothetical protein